MIGLNLLNLVVTTVMAFVLAWVATRTRKIESLEGELKAAAAHQVDTQIAAKTMELSGLIRVLTNEIQGINRRLERGDGYFDQLGQKGHELELKLIERITERCATKEDMRLLSQRFDAMQQAMARVIVQRVERPLVAKEQL